MSAPNAPGMITAFRADRLGARLIALVNTIRLAEKFGVERRMHWMETTGVGIEFNDINALFDADFTRDLLMPRDAWLAFRPRAKTFGDFNRVSSTEVADWLAGGGDIRVETAFGLVCLADEDPAEVAKTSRHIFLNLPFAVSLGPLIENVQDAVKNSIAYHMRRGDLVSNIKAMNKSWPHKFVPEAYYHAHMAQAIKDKQDVVVFSDEAETLKSATAAFPKLKTINDIVPMEDLSPGARDFLELYAMSACTKIIAPEASAFSATAASLGGSQRIDVKADMPSDLRDACSEELYQTLRNNPETLGPVGTVGQTLPHVCAYLIEAGRIDDAIALYDGFIARRTPISFLYPQYMEMLLDTGQYDNVLKLSAELPELPLYDSRGRHRCIAHTLSAHAAKGSADACSATLVSLFAQFPLAGELNKILPFLLYSGDLTSSSFLPFSEEIVFGYGRGLGLKGHSKTNRAVIDLIAPETAVTLPKNLRGTPEPIWWDWSPLLPGNVVAVSERKGMLNEIHDDLSAAKFIDLSPDAASTLALLVAYKGRIGQGLKLLSGLGTDGNKNAMVQHRISLVYWMSRDWKAAAHHAVAAADLSDAPAHLGWAGVILKRDRKAADQAHAYLTKAIQAGLPFSIFALSLADLERRAGCNDAAFEALNIAQFQSPAEVQPQVAIAELHDSTGASQTARKIYAELHQTAKLPMKCYPRLGELYLLEGDVTSAREVIAHALRHKPDAAALLEMRTAVGLDKTDPPANAP